MVHHTLFRCLWPGAARSTRTVLVSTSAGGRSGGSRLLTQSCWERLKSMTAYGQSGLDHLTVWPSLPDCFTSNKRLVAHVWPSVTPKFSMAGGLDPQRRERVKYVNQTFTYFSIIVWIHNVLFCKMIFCCSLTGSFTSLTSSVATNTLFPKGLKSWA